MRPEEQAVSREEWREQAEYRREPEGQAVSRGEYRGRAVCLERRREDLGNVRRKAA